MRRADDGHATVRFDTESTLLSDFAYITDIAYIAHFADIAYVTDFAHLPDIAHFAADGARRPG